MANECVYSYRRTRSVSTGRRRERWTWCMLVFLFMNCSGLAKATHNGTVFIHPEGDIYVRYGSPLEIYCTAGGNSSAKDLNFTLSGVPLPTEIYNETTIRLFIEKPDVHTRQPYYCKNNKTSTNALTSVVVASPPANVTDFKCVSKNIEVLNCSWTTPDLIIFTNYSVAFLKQDKPGKYACVATSIDGTLTRYCTWTTTSQPRYRQQEKEFYFQLDAENVFGNNSQKFSIDHYSIVKPDPPMDLVNVSVNSHAVQLQWNVPNNLADFLKGRIEYKIEYQIAKIDNTSFFRRVNITELEVTDHFKTYKYNLTGLPYAHMQYGVRIYIKTLADKSGQHWSDFKNIVIYTASELPGRPPDVAAGAFKQNKFDKYRIIHVYWKQLEEYEEAGANFTYKIVIRYGPSKTDTLFPDSNKGLGFLVLDRATLDAMDIYISSFNEIGSSMNSSHLYIPPARDTNSFDLNSFTKLAYENGTYELSWFTSGSNVDNYTLFWCQHNTTDLCNGRIDFTVLGPQANKHVISLPRDYRFQFAISANKGSRSSGMFWATCDISKDEIAMYRFPILFTGHDAAGKTFVKLTWSMDCILKDGIITGYNISYCPVIETSNLCDKSGKNHSKYIDNPKKMSTVIEDLEPYRTYQFRMALNTTYGLKTIENTTISITTLEDTPTIPRNVGVSEIRSNSLLLSWDQPEHLNGHISKIIYIVYNFNKKHHTVHYDDKISDDFRINLKLDNIQAFTNYSWTLQACNEGIRTCSANTTAIALRTCIGAPSKPLNFRSSDDYLTWESPTVPGGTVDLYQIKIVINNETSEILNTTDKSFASLQCQGTLKSRDYFVRAINYDEDRNHGALSDSVNVTLPIREDLLPLEYTGEWSEMVHQFCDNHNNLFLFFIIMGVLAIIGIGCGILKGYKKIIKMRDIKPEFPKGLFVVPEKDNKYPFGGLYPTDKEEKPTSDEALLLPNSKTAASTPDLKQKESDNCASSDHTDSTALSEVSQGPMDRQISTSDDDSHSSLGVEANKNGDRTAVQEGSSSSTSDTDSSRENSPYFSDSTFKKNKVTGYVQPVVNPTTGYAQSMPTPFRGAVPVVAPQPASSSYVMAGLPPPIFSTGVPAPIIPSQPPASSGYVRPEDAQPRPGMNFPKLGASPTKIFGSESLPTMPTLPPPAKAAVDSSYIQLQSLDSLPSHKPTVRNTVPLKPPAPSGYVSPGDAVINKHLKNIMSGGQLAEESAILDPAMSPDAYCRFSWSTDPANDNLHSLLGNSPTINSSKN